MESDAHPHLPVNHVLVDFEHVKKVEVGVLERKNVVLHLFLGPHNKKLDVDVVEKLLEHSQAVRMVLSPKSGNDALDFVLAYHLGQVVQTELKARFHIVSRDVGFDSLVEFLQFRHLKLKRRSTWEELEAVLAPAVKTVAASPAPAPPSSKKGLSPGAEKQMETLRKSEKNRPKKRATLVSHATSLLGKNATAKDGEAVVEGLLKAGLVEIDEKGALIFRI